LNESDVFSRDPKLVCRKMKLGIPSDILANINQKGIILNLGIIWKKFYKILFFVLLFSAIIFGGYVWNRNLHSSTWDEQKKQEFVKSQDKGVVFNENNFEKALEIVGQRAEENSKTSDVGKDFFSSY